MTTPGNNGLKHYGSIMLKGSMAQTLSHGATNLVSFLLLPIITKYLSPEDFGIFSMVASVVVFFNLIYNPGILSATTRLYHDTTSELERRTLIGSAAIFFKIFPLIITVVFLLIGPSISKYIFSDFAFFPWGVFAVLIAYFSQSNRIWSTLMSLQYKVHVTALYSFVSVLFGITVTLILVVGFRLGALGKVLGMFPPVIFIYLIASTTVRKYTGGIWNLNSLKKQLVMGFPLIIAIWSYSILDISDRYVLERLTDMESVGIYSFGYKLAQMPMFIVLGARQLWNPLFYENMNKAQYSTISRLTELYIASICFVNMAVILFSKELVLLLINERYLASIPVIGVVVLGVFSSALLTISNSILGYRKLFSTTSVIALLSAILNIGLNLLFIPMYGIMAAAFTTAFSYFIYLVLGLFLVRNDLKRLKFMRTLVFSAVSLVLTYGLTTIFSFGELSLIEVAIKILYMLLFIASIYWLNVVRRNDIANVVSIVKSRFGSIH